MIICISFIHHNFLHQLVFWFPGSDRDEVYKEIFEQENQKNMKVRTEHGIGLTGRGL